MVCVKGDIMALICNNCEHKYEIHTPMCSGETVVVSTTNSKIGLQCGCPGTHPLLENWSYTSVHPGRLKNKLHSDYSIQSYIDDKSDYYYVLTTHKSDKIFNNLEEALKYANYEVAVWYDRNELLKSNVGKADDALKRSINTLLRDQLKSLE